MFTKLFFVFVSILVSLSIDQQYVNALQCWRCSSDASNAAFCNDPLDESVITEQQKRWALVNCTYRPKDYDPSSQRAVCIKTIQLVNNSSVISRSCFWEDINAGKNDCMNLNAPSYIKTTFCETCDTDGCNKMSKSTINDLI